MCIPPDAWRHKAGGRQGVAEVTVANLGGVPNLSSKLAPRPLPDPPVLDSPVGFQVVDSFRCGPFRLADA